MKEGPVPTVQNNLESSRYEMYLDGQRAGFLKYRMENGQMWMLGTQMTAEHEDPALTQQLLLRVLQDIRKRRIAALPFCPAARQAMLENPQFLKLIPADPPGHFPLLMDAVELMHHRGAATVSLRDGKHPQGRARIPAYAVVRTMRTLKKEQKRTARFRFQANADQKAVAEKAVAGRAAIA